MLESRLTNKLNGVVIEETVRKKRKKKQQHINKVGLDSSLKNNLKKENKEINL